VRGVRAIAEEANLSGLISSEVDDVKDLGMVGEQDVAELEGGEGRFGKRTVYLL